MNMPSTLLGVIAVAGLLISGCSSNGGTDAPRGSALTPSSGASAPTPTTEPVFSGEGSSAFCALARTVAGRLQTATAGNQSARSVLQEAEDSMASLAAAAPAEIRDDARSLAKAYARLTAGKTTDFDDQQFRVAGDRLIGYYQDVCGMAVG